MSKHPSFTVATLGFDERERAMLRDVLRLSEHRRPTFRVYGHADGALPHILFVNADSAEVIAKWRAFRRAHGARFSCSSIFLSRRPDAIRNTKYVAARPIAVSQLFSLFDRAAAEDHGYQARRPEWRPPFVLSSQEHALFRAPPVRAVPTPAVRPARSFAPSCAAHATAEIAVIMEPTDSNASTISARTILEAAAHARITAPSERAAPVSACKARILVVDDSLNARVQMKTALQPFATAIDFADSAERAVRMIDHYKYALVFIDVVLPGKSGFALCKHIRRHALQKRTPVIMLSSKASAEERAAGEAVGCDAFLTKPIRETVLAEIISDYIKAPQAA